MDIDDTTSAKKGPTPDSILDGVITRALAFLRGDAGVADFAKPGDPRAAVAALLVEAALQDDRFVPEERACITYLLMKHFALSTTATQELLTAAESANASTHALFGHVGLLIKHVDMKSRITLVEMLWEVAYADGELKLAERSLVEKLTEILSVSQYDSAEAQVRVRARTRV